jgi:hypothetical protein
MASPGATDPEAALAEVRRLRQRASQRAHGGAWFPAAAIAILLLASIALYRYPFASPSAITAEYPYWAGLPDEQRAPLASYAFWFLGAPLVFAMTAVWYRWRVRRVGMRVAWRSFIATGLGVLLLLAVLAAVPQGDRYASQELASTSPAFWTGFLTPLLPVAAAVLMLGWAERSPFLTAAGAWIAFLALWLCSSFPLGYLPGWVTSLMSGGAPSLGGQLALRPGHYVILMALPLIAFAFVLLVSLARTRPAGD